jgi:hypothetical protein
VKEQRESWLEFVRAIGQVVGTAHA